MLRIGMLTSGGDCHGFERGNARSGKGASVPSGTTLRFMDFRKDIKD